MYLHTCASGMDNSLPDMGAKIDYLRGLWLPGRVFVSGIPASGGVHV